MDELSIYISVKSTLARVRSSAIGCSVNSCKRSTVAVSIPVMLTDATISHRIATPITSIM